LRERRLGGQQGVLLLYECGLRQRPRLGLGEAPDFLLAEAAAANTMRSYASALRYWAGWHAARYGIEMTLSVVEATVLQFVVDHVVRRSAEGELAWELPPAVDQTQDPLFSLPR
jgi:hypothetical protein